MSRVPLSVSLSGFGINFGFRWKGSRVLEGFLIVFFKFHFKLNFHSMYEAVYVFV